MLIKNKHLFELLPISVFEKWTAGGGIFGDFGLLELIFRRKMMDLGPNITQVRARAHAGRAHAGHGLRPGAHAGRPACPALNTQDKDTML